jgi:hypothetical protein
MPYNNPYNRAIAHTLHDVNERFAHLYAYSPVDGRGGLAGNGSAPGVLFQMGNASKRDGEDNIVNDNVQPLPEVYYYGNDAEEMKGGNGFAEGTFRDRGDGVQEGVATGHYMKGGHRFGDESERRDDLGYQEHGYRGYGMCSCDKNCGGAMCGGGWFDFIKDIAGVASHVGDIANATGQVVNTVKNIGSGADCGGSKMGSILGALLKEKHGAGMSGGSFWEDLGNTALSILPFIALGKPKMKGGAKQGAMFGQMLKEKMEGKGLSGGSFWEDLGNTALSILPFIALGKPRGRPKKVGGAILGAEDGSKVGGAILGNPDPYPVKGNSARLAGRGKKAKELIGNKQHDLLAMPSPVLANGVPPASQLRGAYGGAKPDLKEKVMKAVAKKLKGGKNLSGMTDMRANVTPFIGTVMPEPSKEVGTGSGDGRKKRAEIVKRIMKERGVKMIQASKIVKDEGLYKK